MIVTGTVSIEAPEAPVGFELLRLRICDARVGDVIVDHTYVGDAGWRSEHVGYVSWRITSIDPDIQCGNIKLCRSGIEVFVKVHRPIVSKPAASHWNGKCPRCRGNIYTGFSDVEHEGSCM